ncbi:MAG: hypothetical protein GY845_03395 [Planctomycetes bacterium]|nr:hypothetical protein [Planctomycetota bacterium]
MTTRYANPSGSSTSPYDTFAKGVTTPQTIIDLAVAGDINIYGGTFTEGTNFTTSLDFDTNSGDTTSGHIIHLGANSSGVVDGTKGIIDGNSNATIGFNIDTARHYFENFDIGYCSGDGVDMRNAAADYLIFVNCEIHNNGVYGLDCGDGGAVELVLILCNIHSNTSDGLFANNRSKFFNCVISDNSGSGIDGGTSLSNLIIVNNLIHNNTTYGIQDLDASSFLFNNIIDGEATGILFADGEGLLIGNRITNCTQGVDFATQITFAGWNYFSSNTSNFTNATLAMNLPYREGMTNRYMSGGLDGTNSSGASDGYNDRANDDFNLKSDAVNRRVEVDTEVGS